MAVDSSPLGRQRQAYRAFLRKFLPVFFRRLGVDALMNSDYASGAKWTSSG
jgi:hypothetical protein